MKRFGFALTFFTFFAFSVFLSQFACDIDKHPVITPMPPPTATPFPVINITIAGTTYLPSAVTVTTGTYVVWTNTDAYGHTVSPSDVLGNCLTEHIMGGAPSAPYTIQCNAPGTIYFHCGFHNNGTCFFFGGICNASCGPEVPGSVMYGTILVQ